MIRIFERKIFDIFIIIDVFFFYYIIIDVLYYGQQDKKRNSSSIIMTHKNIEKSNKKHSKWYPLSL